MGYMDTKKQKTHWGKFKQELTIKIMRMGAQGIWELQVPSTQFCHEPKTALKKS